MESLASYIPAGDWKIANLFLQCSDPYIYPAIRSCVTTYTSSSSCRHLAGCHVFIVVCSGFTIFCKSPAIIYPAFCRCRLPVYTIFELSSHYLSSFLQFFAAYLQFFASLQLLSIQLSTVVLYTIFATL
jgi:hypothetical protein